MGARQKAYQHGQIAEAVGSLYLRCKGYRILGRRVATPVGEIDILAYKNNTYVAVEVKYRQTYAQGVGSITPHQQRRIQRALLLYCSQKPFIGSDVGYRCDALIIQPWRWPHHLTHAWWND